MYISLKRKISMAHYLTNGTNVNVFFKNISSYKATKNVCFVFLYWCSCHKYTQISHYMKHKQNVSSIFLRNLYFTWPCMYNKVHFPLNSLGNLFLSHFTSNTIYSFQKNLPLLSSCTSVLSLLENVCFSIYFLIKHGSGSSIYKTIFVYVYLLKFQVKYKYR